MIGRSTSAARRAAPLSARLTLASALLLLGCGGGGAGGGDKGQTAGMAASTNLKHIGKPSVEIMEEREAAKKKAKKKRKKKKKKNLHLPKPDDFTARDFLANPEESRDPFRNYLVQVEKKKKSDPGVISTVPVLLRNHALSALRVTGIMGARKRVAMIPNPRTNISTPVHTRDRIGKEQALVFQINADHVVLLVPRVRPGAKEPFERKTLYVDAERKLGEISSERLRPDETGIRLSDRRRRRRRRSKEP